MRIFTCLRAINFFVDAGLSALFLTLTHMEAGQKFRLKVELLC